MTPLANPIPDHEGRIPMIARLGGLIDETIGPLFDPARSETFALVDFPDFPNVGDSAIWAGEIAWLRSRLRRRPNFVGRRDIDWDRLDAVARAGTVLIHGGGNFGDLWPAHQEFRHAVLERYPGRPVIQMPQSIHYDDPASIDATARIIARHGAFTLLVRDQESLELARSRFDCEVWLCPDMAFCLGPLSRPAPPTHEGLMLLRTDHEARGGPAAEPPQGWLCDDWLADEPDFHKTVKRRTRLRHLAMGRLPLAWGAPDQSEHFDIRASARIDRGLRMLSQARIVVTDRLHVHILATLLGIPHVILDNSYGKIHRLSRAFGTAWDGVRSAATLPEAMEIAGREHSALRAVA